MGASYGQLRRLDAIEASIEALQRAVADLAERTTASEAKRGPGRPPGKKDEAA